MIALVGRPNSGKTTLFNWLTGSRFRAVNYPGATVECYLGQIHSRYGDAEPVIDTPGIYSLFPKSPDEEVTFRTLFAQYRNYAVERVVVVVDATQWSRQWPLIEQLKESGVAAVLALTMADLVSETEQNQIIQLLGTELGWPVVAVNGQLGGGVVELVDAVKGLSRAKDWTPPAVWSEERYQKSLNKGLELYAHAKQSAVSPAEKARQQTAALDSILLHPFFGLFLFMTVMTTLFSSIFWLADPFMGFVDEGFSALGSFVLGFGAENLFVDLLANGVIAAFGAVLVFVPQIFILFIGISLLEDSGYLARAATLVDKPFSLLGMSGRSFVPLLSGYACAVPAMMAARNITSVKERWIVMFVLPLMSCSARLPVYALLLSFLFWNEQSWKPGLALAALYLGSIFVGGVAAGIVNRIVQRKDENSFLMELPLYRRPSMRLILTTSFMRTKAYVRRAGPIIFVLALVVWAGSTFPRTEAESASVQLENSFIGQAGHFIEPLFEPMGSDWRIGVGLISAFAAREVFVSTLAIVFNSDAETEEGLTESLIMQMKSATWPDGVPLFTGPAVAAILVFFLIALQCLSTFAMAQREMRSWTFAITQLVALNVVAYILAVVTYQGLSLLL
jgi:ferrous iron transport protein B